MSRRKQPSTNLVLASEASPLPGEVAVNQEVIDEAVSAINRMYTVKGLETARAIGEYVLQAFFGGDPSNFRQRGKAHLSFRKLAERDDLQPSYSFIWNSVNIVEQLRLLPENIAEALPVSHHKLLLPVKDEKAKLALAREAAEKGLNRDQFAKKVMKVRDKQRGDSKVGRPPLPSMIKGLSRLRKVVDGLVGEDLSGKALAASCRTPRSSSSTWRTRSRSSAN